MTLREMTRRARAAFGINSRGVSGGKKVNIWPSEKPCLHCFGVVEDDRFKVCRSCRDCQRNIIRKRQMEEQ